MQERVGALRTAEQRLKDMENNALRPRRKSSHVNSAQEYSTQHTDQLHQQSDISCQLAAISAQKARTQASLSQLEQQLGQENKTRSR